MITAALAQVSEEARMYALEELCRRAGLTDEDRRLWRAHATDEGFILRRGDGAGGVVFPHATSTLRPDLCVRKGWLREPAEPVRSVVPDLVVPYATSDSLDGEPLFTKTAPGAYRCNEDLLASTALVLSRYEEMVAANRDEHGRFRSADSIARRDGYLDRPIVDEWGLALEQVIAELEPGHTMERRLRVKVSHDVDLIGIPFGMREPAVQAWARREYGVALRDVLSGFTSVMPGSLQQVIEICERMQKRGLQSALYWKASARTAYDSGYDIHDRRVARVVNWAREQGIEMGVHPGYYAFGNDSELSAEVERCRAAIGETAIGGRQHYLRWSPQTWHDWELCGLAYDSSVGFADCVGFRAGTCWPYRPWLWNENHRAELLEIPLIVMEQSLVSPLYMGLTPEQSTAAVQSLLEKCAAVGGVFTLLWHNNCLGRPFAAHLPGILDALAGIENYDWRVDG